MTPNIREAEERAKRRNDCVDEASKCPTAAALLEIAALYREAVEALRCTKQRLETIRETHPTIALDSDIALADAVLAKAQEVLGAESERPNQWRPLEECSQCKAEREKEQPKPSCGVEGCGILHDEHGHLPQPSLTLGTSSSPASVDIAASTPGEP